MKYLLKNTQTRKVIKVSLNWILEEINRDRSDEWTPYDKNDWKEGLEQFTEYKFLQEVKEC